PRTSRPGSFGSPARAAGARRDDARRRRAPSTGTNSHREESSLMSGQPFKYFRMQTDDRGITVVTFDRPPVNAISFDAYPAIRQLAEIIEATDQTRVVVLTSPPGSRAWCGGADVRDFLPLDAKSRMDRYAMINECLPKFYNLNRPVVGAINSHAV